MVTTRAQARAQSGTNSVPQPTYYETEDDSHFESEEGDFQSEDSLRAVSPSLWSEVTDRSENGSEMDEDEVSLVPYPSSVQSPSQSGSSSESSSRVVTDNHSPPSSNLGIRVFRSTEPQVNLQTTAHEDISYQYSSHEETILQERLSNPLIIFEEQLASGPPSFKKDLLKLEFYQTFPHDPAAILCKTHFLQLVERWFKCRQGDTERMIHGLSEEFPYGKLENLLHNMRDMEILKQVMREEQWRQMPYDEFKDILEGELDSAESELGDQRKRAIVDTGKLPRCALESCGALSCGYCLASKNGRDDLYKLVREARAKGPHIVWREDDEAAVKEFERKEVNEEVESIDMRPSYVSIGGLHFIVDACNGVIMIRFQSTRAAFFEGPQNWRAKMPDLYFYDRPGIFDVKECCLNEDNCACTNMSFGR